MIILTKLTDLLYRRQKALGIITVFLFLSIVAFRYDSKSTTMLWSDYPSIAIILALFTALIAIVWLKIEKQKTKQLIDNLKSAVSVKEYTLEYKMADLSARQLDVLNLIITGKSNKEITSELNIELSTLKTHINQLYKTLGIKNRKEAKSFKIK